MTASATPNPVYTGFNTTVSGSITDPGPDTFTGTINWGDGSPTQNLASITMTSVVGASPATATYNSPSHSYLLPGTYTVTVTVLDGDGGTGTARYYRHGHPECSVHERRLHHRQRIQAPERPQSVAGHRLRDPQEEGQPDRRHESPSSTSTFAWSMWPGQSAGLHDREVAVQLP